jgi:hypothetical protein
MADPITLIALAAFITKNAPSWLTSLHGTILDKGQALLVDKGESFALTKSRSVVRRIFHLDEKEQLRHLEQALRNATERGLVTFDTLQERDLYRDILKTLSQPGPMGDTLRHEIMQLFTLEEIPDLTTLSEIYNRRQRLSNAAHQDIDAGPYLKSFFTALWAELYADPYFKSQLSEALQLRAAQSMRQSLLDIINVLERIGETLEGSYSAEDFARNVDVYTSYIERTQHNLRIVGVVPKDQNSDPELSGIFVPLRIQLNKEGNNADDQIGALVSALEHSPCLVLLGGPGSGKSTATKYLAWSHATANQSSFALADMLLLSGQPLPLRIELRRLSEERKRANYDFLSFVSEVLLKRDGIDINPQMFKELLTRRCMLLLFDGLDEVATLEERLGLVNEIEHFALSYPGNRVLVTSRPVGYELARISHPLFSHAEVQNFNDDQIKQFLENWYTAVLRLSPIPQREQDELNLLLTTLKENPRLHKLAEIPLLLTVITALHRYERLPDRRVQLYDRCADLLLETWAKLRGTDKRWQDMKMVKEDQYACIAYLGFVLHERSQEEISSLNRDSENRTVDVSSRFLRKNVEDFLRKWKLLDGVAEQRKEAQRFIALVQEEAGLIVERGTGENGEALYSFVHRTFQEYFAAADIYERYQQKGDPKIIGRFLIEHLHDPHWKEVILLLLGKLKSTPVTNQLRQILIEKPKSKRSQGTDFLQHDLFFVCDCLIDEIKVDNSLVVIVKSSLSNIVKSSPFTTQRQQALEYLGKLMQTRQYKGQGWRELLVLATRDETLNSASKLEIAKILYSYNSDLAEEHQSARRIWTSLLQRPDLPIEQAWQSAVSLYNSSPVGSETCEFATSMLTSPLQRPDLPIKQALKSAESLLNRTSNGPQVHQLVTSMLTSLLQRPDLPIEQAWQNAEFLYHNSAEGSETRELVTSILTSLLQRPDLPIDQVRQTAESLSSNYDFPDLTTYQELQNIDSFTSYVRRKDSEAEQFTIFILTSLLQRPDLPIDQIRQTAESLYHNSAEGSETRELAISKLTSLFQWPDLPIEQAWQSAVSLYRNSPRDSEAHQLATSKLTSLLQRSDLSIDQVWQSAESLYRSSPDLFIDQVRQSNESFSNGYPLEPEAKQFVISMLALLQHPDLPIDQVRQSAELLYIAESLYSGEFGPGTREFAISILISLLQRPDLPIDQVRRTAEVLYKRSTVGSETHELAISKLTSLLQRPDLPIDQAWQSAEFLYNSSPVGSETRELATSILTSLLQRPDLPINQVRRTAEVLYRSGSPGSESTQLATSILTSLLQHPDLPIDQVLQSAEYLYRSSPARSEIRELATSILASLLQRSDLPIDHIRQSAVSLYQSSHDSSDSQLLATSLLLSLLSRGNLTDNQDEIYSILCHMMPQFHKLPHIYAYS